MESFISEEVKMSIEADEQSVCAKLKNLRVRSCIAINEFAEALGVENAELESYENGIEHVPASVIAMACALSGTSYEYFFGEESKEPSVASISHAIAYEEQAALLSYSHLTS